MEFPAPSGPHWHGGSTVSGMMRKVMIGLAPITAVSIWLFGPGVLINFSFAVLMCLLLEFIALRMRDRPTRVFLSDGSAVVTAALISLALPPLIPWWVIATACIFAIVIAKHLYGGLGFNLFNPAMVGYVTVLIAFPQHMAVWPDIGNNLGSPGLYAALDCFLFGTSPSQLIPDIYTAATPLDQIKIQLGQMRTMDEIFLLPGFGDIAGKGWGWINLAALVGGIWLLTTGVIRWHIPIAMLAGLMGLAYGFYILDSATNPSPLVEALSGGTMLGVFFIATDPVSAAASDRGKLIYGFGIGVLCYVLRRWGSNPDGLAFAVLLMNMAVPLIDRFTVPRIYGHRS
jgi:Na+-translocating ferredoxin:NAD+ oxidoreductase subunit D